LSLKWVGICGRGNRERKVLSEKISTLFNIPQQQVGVTYIDAENEEITLNSEEELQDYYLSSYQPGDIIKFSVRDLSSANRRPPVNPGLRNTFGQFVDVDIPGIDEWQSVNNIPSLEEILGRTSPTSETRSAFVETVASDGGAPKEDDNTFGMHQDDGDTRSDATVPRIPGEEKGKERARSMRSMSSTQSLLAADTGDKRPVHVYDVSSVTRSPIAQDFSLDTDGVPIAAESTPRLSTQPLEKDTSVLEKSLERKPEFEDPPLPSFDSQLPRSTEPTESTQSAQASASLARDVAAFLNTVSSVIAFHPELGQSLNTIVRNATNGTYWSAHREALSHAAAEFQRSAEDLAEGGRRAVEEEAGRRVTEALSGVLNIFSQAQASIQPDTSTQPSNVVPDTTAQQPANVNSDSAPQQPDNTSVPPPNDANAQPRQSAPRPQTPPMPGAFHWSNSDARFGPSFPFGRRHTWRPRASMPPNFAPGPGIPAWAMPHRHVSFGTGVLNATGAAVHSQTGPATHFTSAFASVPPEPAHRPDITIPETPINTRNEEHEPSSPQELRAKVEEAKKAYKAEKERYRRERDERRKEKYRETMPKANDSPNTSQEQDTSMPSQNTGITASIPRHGFPGFEIVNITGSTPQRHNTHHGHFPRRHERSVEDLFTRAVNRISRRLADVSDQGEFIRAPLTSCRRWASPRKHTQICRRKSSNLFPVMGLLRKIVKMTLSQRCSKLCLLPQRAPHHLLPVLVRGTYQEVGSRHMFDMF